jgi:hypothetical protein
MSASGRQEPDDYAPCTFQINMVVYAFRANVTERLRDWIQQSANSRARASNANRITALRATSNDNAFCGANCYT